MKQFKIVGTRGKKRRRLLRFIAFSGVVVLAVLGLLICLPLIKGADALAGESAPVTGTSEPPGTKPAEETSSMGAAPIGEFLEEQETGAVVNEDEREISFGPIGIGPNIKPGDYIDVRLMCADGTDYVVVSKKELMDYNASTGMSVIRVRESELLTLNSAMADRNSITGVTLYAVRYVDPESQSAADISYRPNEAVSGQIRERAGSDM
ncbi:MAG: hypothetical protein IKR54_06605 [Lachnospiraceae bacterium]|nr:hypothetical protein [Lachnospiraceae bacterium]